MTRSLILGTAGHIDHGKTALVRALTGVDTDRLKEEKERGITVDLGFAEFAPAEREVRFGVVDVPGHEGFVRNMVAGATGTDVVLLVVAADEGVMPQTREHLAIVDLLDVRRVVAAVTKVDRVEEEGWTELVVDEVRELLEARGMVDAPVVLTSARTGEGLDDLTEALIRVAGGSSPPPQDDAVRLPVDRVFTVRGTGTVVTGTLRSGRIATGDRLEVAPGGFEVRVRRLQVHGEDVPTALAGQRTAVALAGPELDRDRISRGSTLAGGARWAESAMLTARARCLRRPGRPIEHDRRIRLHLGTDEVMGRVVLLDGDRIGPGESGWVQLRLDRPTVARSGDRFVLRSPTPVTTVGGGIVAEPSPPKRTGAAGAEVLDLLRSLVDGGPRERVTAALDLAGWSGVPAAELPVRAGCDVDRTREAVTAGREAGRLAGDRIVFGPGVVAAARERLLDALREFHAREPLRPGLPLERLRQALPSPEARKELVAGILEELTAAGRIRIDEDVARIADFEPELTGKQERLRERLRAIYRDAALRPPALRELPEEVREADDLEPMLERMRARGELHRLDEEFFIWASAAETAGDEVRRELGGRSELGPAEFREVLPLTRKHLIPLLGYFDSVGVTVRRREGRDVVPPS